jgi:type II secretory pathway component GspD/PulD (secretin)
VLASNVTTTAGAGIGLTTGSPVAPAASTEPPDVGSYIIKIPSLTDVRLADVLDAIALVSDHPLKYSIQDFAVVFSAKGPESQLFMRTFRVAPNTFYSGLESVRAGSFGAVQNGNGSGQSQNNGAVVGGVNAFPGANSDRGTGDGGGRNEQSLQGSSFGTSQKAGPTPSALARSFFTTLGVNLVDPPGKSVFFNDKLGYLFVKATKSDLDTIEGALQVLNQTPPQLHIKARFIEVPKGTRDDLKATNPVFGKPMWILTDTNFRAVLRDLASYSNVETLGEPEATMLSGRQAQMQVTEKITVVTGLLAEPGSGFNPGENSLVPQTSTNEVGPILDVVPYVLADGYTINLAAIPSLKEFLGYDQLPSQPTNATLDKVELPTVRPKFQTQQIVGTANLWDGQTLVLGGLTKQEGPKGKNVPVAGDIPLLGRLFQTMNRQTTNMDVLVFITATIVDPTGRRVHSDDKMPFAKDGVPTQPTGGPDLVPLPREP